MTVEELQEILYAMKDPNALVLTREFNKSLDAFEYADLDFGANLIKDEDGDLVILI